MNLLPVKYTICLEEIVKLNESKDGKFFSETKLAQLVKRMVGDGYKTDNGRRAYFVISAKKGYNIATVDLLSGKISLNHDDHKPFQTYRIAKYEAHSSCQFYNLNFSTLEGTKEYEESSQTQLKFN